MEKINQPSKERIRKWLADRRKTKKPLPELDQIRCQLEWQCLTQRRREMAASLLAPVCAISGW
jgi:hypothetical protein